MDTLQTRSDLSKWIRSVVSEDRSGDTTILFRESESRKNISEKYDALRIKETPALMMDFEFRSSGLFECINDREPVESLAGINANFEPIG